MISTIGQLVPQLLHQSRRVVSGDGAEIELDHDSPLVAVRAHLAQEFR